MTVNVKDLIAQVGTDTSGRWMSVNNVEKFAELIVRECARIANEKEEDFPEYEKDMSVHWYILKHFGVEK